MLRRLQAVLIVVSLMTSFMSGVAPAGAMPEPVGDHYGAPGGMVGNPGFFVPADRVIEPAFADMMQE